MPPDFTNTVLNFSYRPSSLNSGNFGSQQYSNSPALRIADTRDGPVPYVSETASGVTRSISFITVPETMSAMEVAEKIQDSQLDLVLAIGPGGQVSGLMFPDVVVRAIPEAVYSHGFAVSAPLDPNDLSQWVVGFEAQQIQFHSELVNSMTPSTFMCQAPGANHVFGSPAPCKRHPNAPYIPLDIDI